MPIGPPSIRAAGRVGGADGHLEALWRGLRGLRRSCRSDSKKLRPTSAEPRSDGGRVSGPNSATVVKRREVDAAHLARHGGPHDVVVTWRNPRPRRTQVQRYPPLQGPAGWDGLVHRVALQRTTRQIDTGQPLPGYVELPVEVRERLGRGGVVDGGVEHDEVPA